MTSDHIEVRLVSDVELPALARFLVDNFGKNETEEYWLARFRHWWDINPYFNEDIPRGWLLCLGKSIKGFLGNVPTPLRIDGVLEIAFNMTTWRVAGDAKTSSMNLLFAYMRAAKGRYVFCTTPNQNVRKILKLLQFEPFLFETDDIVRIFTSGVGLKTALAARNIPKTIAQFTAFVADPLIRWSFRIPLDFDGKWNDGWDSGVEQALLESFHNCAVTTFRTEQLYRWYRNAKNSEYEYLVVRKHEKPIYFAVLRWYTVNNEIQGEVQEGLALDRVSLDSATIVVSFIARRAMCKRAGRVFFYGHTPDLIESTRRFRISGVGTRKIKEFYKVPDRYLNPKTVKHTHVFFSRLQGDIGI